jgi:acylphosphatase
MSYNKVLLKIIVNGRVQGVGFRQSCLKEARFRGICGIVENKADGSVYIECEADTDQLNDFVRWLRQYRGYGSVDEVTVEPGIVKNFSSFSIRY